MNILEEIAFKTEKRVENLKKSVNYNAVKNNALSLANQTEPFLFEKALKKNTVAFICEIKKASPSKGIITEDFPYIDIAKEYERIGADAVSVLTEPYFFKGEPEYLKQISQNVKIPILRKDFIIDEIQIYETKLIGASGMLLICSLLDSIQLRDFINIADNLGLSCLVEAHTKEETETAVNANARIIGVNNRNLKTFDVDIKNSINLRKYVPSDIIYVSESGINSREQIKELEKNNVNAVLIGETFMKSKNKADELAFLKGLK